MRLLTSVLAGSTLILGFAVAQSTDDRTLGGLVLLAGAIACAMLWWREAGPGPAGLRVLVFLLAFIGSHLLTRVIGAWPSVLVVALATGVLSFILTRPRVASSR